MMNEQTYGTLQTQKALFGSGSNHSTESETSAESVGYLLANANGDVPSVRDKTKDAPDKKTEATSAKKNAASSAKSNGGVLVLTSEGASDRTSGGGSVRTTGAVSVAPSLKTTRTSATSVKSARSHKTAKSARWNSKLVRSEAISFGKETDQGQEQQEQQEEEQQDRQQQQHQQKDHNAVLPMYDNSSSENNEFETCSTRRRIAAYKNIKGFEPVDFLMEIKSFCGVIVRNEYFANFILIAILVNCIMLGVGTYPIVQQNAQAKNIFEKFDFGFLVLFTVEIFLNFLYRGAGLFQDGWLSFDFLVVSLSWAFSQLKVLRAIRIIRILRHAPRYNELRELTAALSSSVPHIFSILVLKLVMFYMSAVVFTYLFQTAYVEGITDKDYFSRLDITVFSLLQFMTLDGWSMVTRDLMKVYSWAWVPMVTFVMTSFLLGINLVIAVICDAVASRHRKADVKESIYGLVGDASKSCSLETSHSQQILQLEQKVDKLTQVIHELLLAQKAQYSNSKSKQQKTFQNKPN